MSQLAAAPQNGNERFAAHVLHDECDVAASQPPQLVLVHDVGMPNTRHEARFALEPREGVRIRDILRRDDFDRDVVSGCAMSRQEN